MIAFEGQGSVQVLFLFRLYFTEKKEYMFSVLHIGEEYVFLSSKEDESELSTSMFLIKCGKVRYFVCFVYA